MDRDDHDDTRLHSDPEESNKSDPDSNAEVVASCATGTLQTLGDDDQTDEVGSVPMQFADWHGLPDEAVNSVELRDAVRQALAKLPAHSPEVLLLIDSQRIDYAAAAIILGVSVEVIKTRVHRARINVQEQLGGCFQAGFADRIHLIKEMNPWFRAKLTHTISAYIDGRPGS